MDQQSIMAIVRATAQGIGGWLAGSGFLTGDDVTSFSGAAVMLASVVWSIAQKKGKVAA